MESWTISRMFFYSCSTFHVFTFFCLSVAVSLGADTNHQESRLQEEVKRET